MEKLNVIELKRALQSLKAPSTGKKSELLCRLQTLAMERELNVHDVVEFARGKSDSVVEECEAFEKVLGGERGGVSVPVSGTVSDGTSGAVSGEVSGSVV